MRALRRRGAGPWQRRRRRRGVRPGAGRECGGRARPSAASICDSACHCSGPKVGARGRARVSATRQCVGGAGRRALAALPGARDEQLAARTVIVYARANCGRAGCGERVSAPRQPFQPCPQAWGSNRARRLLHWRSLCNSAVLAAQSLRPPALALRAVQVRGLNNSSSAIWSFRCGRRRPVILHHQHPIDPIWCGWRVHCPRARVGRAGRDGGHPSCSAGGWHGQGRGTSGGT
jgi:hypothetical protein